MAGQRSRDTAERLWAANFLAFASILFDWRGGSGTIACLLIGHGVQHVDKRCGVRYQWTH